MTRVFPLTASEREAIRRAVAKHGEHAVQQAEGFIKACREQDPEWWQYAANPDLVEALGGTTADAFLGW